ncbi:MAG: hypothetical protein ACTSPQ_00335 [Candidatus Helarchaeota archaeon]
MLENNIGNNILRINLLENENYLSERIEIKKEDNWIPILKNMKEYSALIFKKGKKQYTLPLTQKSKSSDSLEYELDNKEIKINLRFTLSNHIHVKYDIIPKKKLKITGLIIFYEILSGDNPDFKWVPHLRPKEFHIIPDHVFRSPVIIYNKDKYTFAFIPDLEILSKNRPYKMILDFNLNPERYDNPYLFFGFGDYKSVSHILFKYRDKKRFIFKPGEVISLGYYIKVFNNSELLDVLKNINSFLWEKYGRNLLYENLNPQIMPFEINASEGIKAILERHKCWINFKLNGNECGGFFQNTWLGKRKRKYEFITPEKVEKYRSKNISQIAGQETIWGKIVMHFSNSPFWIKAFDKLTRNLPIIRRTAEIWNNAWFLNIRSGYGFRYFGELWKEQDLIDKGDRIFNTVLSLPERSGVFPSVILPAEPNSSQVSTINGLKAFIPTDEFHIVDTCLAMYWALKYYQEFKKDERVIIRAKNLLKLISELQLENGAIPTYIYFDGDTDIPKISDILIDSASSGAALMFLTELYKILKDTKIVEISEGIANYIKSEIIPQNKWHDFEPFFSCTHLPLDFYDMKTKSHCMNNLCIYWCAEGLLGLYKITDKKEYLNLGERTIAILSLFQQVWDMPYISYNTFGGFGCQNEDAELSDARQGLFVKLYMEYYLETGHKEYMERAIATLRACWAMQLLREYKDQCPGNIRGIGTIDGIDRGCVCENYGHSGHDLRIPGYIMFDWGVGTSLTATAYAKKHFGDLFIDFKEKVVWGIDGIIVKSSEFNENIVKITLEIIPNKKYILIKSRGLDVDEIEISLNEKNIGKISKERLNNGFKFEMETDK